MGINIWTIIVGILGVILIGLISFEVIDFVLGCLLLLVLIIGYFYWLTQIKYPVDLS